MSASGAAIGIAANEKTSVEHLPRRKKDAVGDNVQRESVLMEDSILV